jgi:hypothetical protein
MRETWQRVAIPDSLRKLESPFLLEVEELLKRWSGGDEEAYWYLSWRLELAAIDRNMVDQTRVRQELFREQGGICPECGEELQTPRGRDVHKRLRMFAKHQGYVAGNTMLLHRACHERIHQREPHV